MPRQPRPDFADIPQHIVQRGNNRQACFFQKEDYRRYLNALREASLRYGCHVHAYVLMTNHVHLLVTPQQVGAIGRMMQYLGRDYVTHINIQYRRSGTLWEGRYRSCLVDTQTYLLLCHRYIELNPVRAGMVATPQEYPWSSYGANALDLHDPCIRPHAEYLALGVNAEERRTTYRTLFDEGIDHERLAAIRNYNQQQRALGSTRFQAEIEAALGRCMSVRPAHRPAKKPEGE